jgi:hypothetical protein
MVDTTAADAVRAALALTDSVETTSTAASRLRDADLQQVRFSRAELHDWANYLFRVTAAAGIREGVKVSGVGVNAYLDRVDVYVQTEADRSWVEARLTQASIPCGLVVIKLDALPGASTK